MNAKNELVYLDLHERAHGPHGLVAGTTGLGKSEILQSYILSLKKAKEADGYVYLRLGDYQIARVRYEELPDAGKDGITYEWKFQETDLGENGVITEEMEPFMRLVQKINEHNDLQNMMVLKQIQYSDKGETVSVKKETAAWEKSKKELDDLRKIAAVTDGYAEIVEEDYGNYYGTEFLQIMLHMDLEDDYCETAYQRIKELWEKGNLKENHHSSVTFFVGEKEQYPQVIVTKSSEKEAWEFMVYYDDLKGKTFSEYFS